MRDDLKPSGSWLNVPAYLLNEDDPFFGGMIHNTTGTVPLHLAHHNPYPSEEDMWNRMYVRPKPVIIVCGFCKSHNAISNPTCIQCGAPMGYGTER